MPQSDAFFGIINRCAQVLYICGEAFMVDNFYGLTRGDKVFIIKVKEENGAIL